MQRHIIYHPVIVAVLLSVCLAVGGGPFARADQNQGIPRVMYATDFVPGARVVLLDNEPAGGPGLKAGMSGIVRSTMTSEYRRGVCAMAFQASWPDEKTSTS